jgi:hypothetical protein
VCCGLETALPISNGYQDATALSAEPRIHMLSHADGLPECADRRVPQFRSFSFDVLRQLTMLQEITIRCTVRAITACRTGAPPGLWPRHTAAEVHILLLLCSGCITMGTCRSLQGFRHCTGAMQQV